MQYEWNYTNEHDRPTIEHTDADIITVYSIISNSRLYEDRIIIKVNFF